MVTGELSGQGAWELVKTILAVLDQADVGDVCNPDKKFIDWIT